MNWFLLWLFAPPLTILLISWIVSLSKGEITFDPPDNLRLSDRATDRLTNSAHERDKGWREANP